VPPEEVARLRRHRLATGRPADGGLVFSVSDGEPLSPVPRAFRRAALAARVAPIEAKLERAQEREDSEAVEAIERELTAAREAHLPRLHDLRHAYATHALASGLSAHAVARLLGHSDAGLVWRRYGHALPEELARAGEVLSAWRAARCG
jgi:integrase